MLLPGFTILVSAFLFFQLQPLIGKHILPWFGGGPAIWTTCLLFFQVALLVGYGYAHIIGSRLPTRIASGLHASLLCLSVLALPIEPSPLWKFTSTDSPSVTIFVLLATTIGLPCFLLATTTPLVQKWHSMWFPKRSTYRLYALSNVGSLLALLSYPLIFEPLLSLQNQTLGWSAGYIFFVCLGIWSCLRTSSIQSKLETEASTETNEPVSRPQPLTIFLWIAFSATAAALLLATTNQMCQGIAVVPFLWIAPLTIYLLTFIICFDREDAYRRTIFGVLLGLTSLMAIGILAAGLRIDAEYHIIVYGVALFVCCMCCNGELVRIKPHTKHLTFFYLCIAVGGVLGGVAVAVVAPLLLTDFSEYPFLIAVCGILILFQWCRLRIWTFDSYRLHWIIGSMAGVGLSVVSAIILLGSINDTVSILTSRNFHGVLRLTKEGAGDDETLRLSNGQVLHGAQFTSTERQSWPTTYYGPKSAVGLALSLHPKRRDSRNSALRIGVIGLGVGTIATHATASDYLRFYEINPAVIDVAMDHFTYLRQTSAEIDIVRGDARIQMEAELIRNEPQDFDILVVDAFTSDAIPIHLLTAECASIYWKHLRHDGLLLFHISNQSLDLAPVIRGLADLRDATALTILDAGDYTYGISASTWVVLTVNSDFVMDERIVRTATAANGNQISLPVWTDSFASLWQVLR